MLPGFAWSMLAALLIGIGALFLGACDLGTTPFGLRYCRAVSRANALAPGRARGRYLRAGIHKAEFRTARPPPSPQNNPPPPLAPPAPRAPAPVQPPAPEPPPRQPDPPRAELRIPT